MSRIEFKHTDALTEKLFKKGPVIIDQISFERLEEDKFQIHCFSKGVLVAKLKDAVYLSPRNGLSINNLGIMSIGSRDDLSLFTIE